MNSLCEAPDCGRPVQDARVCGACTGRLEDALRQVPDLAEDLEIARVRQARLGSGGGGGDRLPWDQRAAEAAAVLRSALVGWVRVADEASGAHGAPEGLPADTLPAMAGWLLDRVERLRHHEAAGEAVDEILAAVAEARRAIDRPAQRWYAGPCDACGTGMYARLDDRFVICREHDEPIAYEVGARRDQMLSKVADQLAPAAQVLHLLGLLGVPVTKVQIHRWAHGPEGKPERIRLWPHGRDAAGRPLYRVGDVHALAAEAATRQAELKRRAAERRAAKAAEGA